VLPPPLAVVFGLLTVVPAEEVLALLTVFVPAPAPALAKPAALLPEA
jgi:hypothetical protein